MDAWARLFRDEEKQRLFLIGEEFSMEQGTIQSLQEMALGAFERVPQSEAAAWLQAMMQAEIALQLQALNDKLETITERGGSADLQCQQLKDIVIAVEALNPGR
jgi:hypothetical protein